MDALPDSIAVDGAFGSASVTARRSTVRRLKILFLSLWCPYPLDNGTRIRQYNLLRYLAQYHDVSLFTFLPDETWRASLPALEIFCKKVVGIQSRMYDPSSLRSIAGLFSPLPRVLAATDSREMRRLIARETADSEYDVFIAGEIGAAHYVEASTARIALLDDPEIAVLYDRLQPTQKRVTRWRHRVTQVKFERFMRRTLSRYNACGVVSRPELALVQPLAPAGLPIRIIPNGVDTHINRPGLRAPAPDTLVFSGSLNYFANRDAVEYFLRDIFPLIRQEIPTAALTVTGRHNGVLPGTLEERQQVVFTGFVDDVRPVVAGSQVSIVPLRQGGGTRLKVLEAMALGVPVVSTSKGVEGLDVVAGRHALIEDDPRAFAEAVVRLLSDPHMRETLTTHARRLVETTYDWQGIGARMNDLILETLARREAQP